MEVDILADLNHRKLPLSSVSVQSVIGCSILRIRDLGWIDYVVRVRVHARNVCTDPTKS
jgi:hypothetical protein